MPMARVNIHIPCVVPQTPLNLEENLFWSC